MSSACPQAAKSLFAESKRRLSDRVAVNVNNCASVARQIVRGNSMKLYKAKLVIQLESISFIFQAQNLTIYSCKPLKVSLNKKLP